jgi:drug/metabolite transporter (DMT)-like permease
MRSDNLKLAVAYGSLAAFFYALLGTLMKVTEQAGATNETLVFFRQMIGLITLLPFLTKEERKFTPPKTSSFPLHLLRAISSLCAMYCLIFSLKYLPLVDALVLTYTRPLFLPIIVFFWFRKKWSKNTFFGILIGFLGVACILKPDRKMFDIGAFVALASALFGSISFTCIRKLTRTDSANTILLYYLLLSIPLAIIPVLFNWSTPKKFDWVLLAIIGICGLIYQMALTRAYQHAKAFKVSSILYSTAIFAAFFDWWLGDFSLDYLGFAGIALIIIGTIVTVRQKVSPFPPEISDHVK